MFIFNVKKHLEIIWQLTNLLVIKDTNISHNTHENGNDLVSISNGVIELSGSVQVICNSYYENIIKLHMSTLVCIGQIKLFKNLARFILRAKAISYFALSENTSVNISFNTVYKVAMQDLIFSADSKPICPIQFFGNYKFSG